VHTYESAGSYIITASATAGSETFTTSTAVTVNPRSAFGVSVTAAPPTPPRCSPVEFTAAVTGAEATSVVSYRWQIDSNDNSEDETVTTSGPRLTRVFRQTGTKTITVTATTNDGRTGSGQTQIVVQPSTSTC
jgi:hypothetical protein